VHFSSRQIKRYSHTNFENTLVIKKVDVMLFLQLSLDEVKSLWRRIFTCNICFLIIFKSSKKLKNSGKFGGVICYFWKLIRILKFAVGLKISLIAFS